MSGAPKTFPRLPRRFHLNRVEDESGISGTGRVAEGVVFANGWCALVWLTQHTSCAFYTSIREVIAIHGHSGKTHVEFDDCKHCGHATALHWRDNCGGCDAYPCQCSLMEHPEGVDP